VNRWIGVGLAGLLAAAAPARAQGRARPAPAPAGPVSLAVDATGAPGHRLRARLSLPVTPGPLTLLYPQWLPGEHGPTGPITSLVGLEMSAGGQVVPWRRDPRDMYAFQVTVPPGARTLDVRLEYVAPTGPGFTSGGSTTPRLAVLSWNHLLLYPKGAAVDRLLVEPRLRLPAGWAQASSLKVQSEQGGEVAYAPVSLALLVDAPVLLGASLQRVDLGVHDQRPHEVAVAADGILHTTLPDPLREGLRRLVGEAGALFGARPYGSYRWLLALSDNVAHFGLEHHESSDNRMPERTFSRDWDRRGLGFLLAHEYAHSWNGKYRRPADMVATDLNTPVNTGLLWVYEGLTQYLGTVLAARSGLWTPETFREEVAFTAATLDTRAGRAWRPLVDTTVAAQLLFPAPADWTGVRRSVDFYDEGTLIWLEADAIIRRQSAGQRSLDDFLRRFHGGGNGVPEMVPYTLDDVVKALNDVAPHDWRGFVDARVHQVNRRAPLGGLEALGWRLTYTDATNQAIEDAHEERGVIDAWFSLGFSVSREGRILDVNPDAPLGRAGAVPGMTLVGIGGRAFSRDTLRDALREGNGGTDPLEVVVTHEGFVRTLSVAYHDGERYPHLERIDGVPDGLADVLRARAPGPSSPAPR
jgi:predicted metalloprotease with PDZ domain